LLQIGTNTITLTRHHYHHFPHLITRTPKPMPNGPPSPTLEFTAQRSVQCTSRVDVLFHFRRPNCHPQNVASLGYYLTSAVGT
jgi:hypothetical protein